MVNVEHGFRRPQAEGTTIGLPDQPLHPLGERSSDYGQDGRYRPPITELDLGGIGAVRRRKEHKAHLRRSAGSIDPNDAVRKPKI